MTDDEDLAAAGRRLGAELGAGTLRAEASTRTDGLLPVHLFLLGLLLLVTAVYAVWAATTIPADRAEGNTGGVVVVVGFLTFLVVVDVAFGWAATHRRGRWLGVFDGALVHLVARRPPVVVLWEETRLVRTYPTPRYTPNAPDLGAWDLRVDLLEGRPFRLRNLLGPWKSAAEAATQAHADVLVDDVLAALEQGRPEAALPAVGGVTLSGWGVQHPRGGLPWDALDLPEVTARLGARTLQVRAVGEPAARIAVPLLPGIASGSWALHDVLERGARARACPRADDGVASDG